MSTDVSRPSKDDNLALVTSIGDCRTRLGCACQEDTETSDTTDQGLAAINRCIDTGFGKTKASHQRQEVE